MKYIWDKNKNEWVPKHLYYAPTEHKSPYVISDIEPYKAMGGDMAGKMITSRSAHREFLQRNGFIEVGNEHREFFEYGGKTRDNPFAERNHGYERIRAELEGRTRRRA